MSYKILVCDDENAMRRMTVNAIKPKGYDIADVDDGTSAIEYVKREKPSLLLLDMRLPDIDGLDVLSEVKKIYPEMEVIMISGFGDVDHAVEALKLGAFDYISKPYKIDALQTRVADALAKHAAAVKNTQTPSSSVSASSVSPAVPEQKKQIPEPDLQVKPSKTAAPAVKKEDAAALPVQDAKDKSEVKQAEKPRPPLSSMWKMLFWILLAAVIISGANVAVFMYMFNNRKNQNVSVKKIGRQRFEYAVPYSNPAAMTYGGGSIWVADWVTQSIYRHKMDGQLSINYVYNMKDSHITGLAWDGATLWSCDPWEGKIYKHNMDKELSTAATYPCLGITPSGLYWDGLNLWLCDGKGGNFYKLKVTPSGTEIADAYNSPGAKPVGLFFDGEYYFSGDAKTGRIYKHRKSDMKVVQILMAPEYEDGKTYLSGLAWDGKYVWTCAEGAKKIFKHTLEDLRVSR